MARPCAIRPADGNSPAGDRIGDRGALDGRLPRRARQNVLRSENVTWRPSGSTW